MIRILKKIVKRLINLTIKTILVAIPAIISAFLSYRAGVLDSEAEIQKYVVAASRMYNVLREHGEVIAEMKGEVAVLRQLAANRVEMGLSPFPGEKYTPPSLDDIKDLLPSDTAVFVSQHQSSGKPQPSKKKY